MINIKFEVRQDRGRCWGRGNDEPRGETETRESKTGERKRGRERHARHKILLLLQLVIKRQIKYFAQKSTKTAGASYWHNLNLISI